MVDAHLRIETPYGSSWRRYNHDGYGQKADGSDYDGTGEGRCWPILAGERAHYEQAAGRDPLPFIEAMEKFANEGELIFKLPAKTATATTENESGDKKNQTTDQPQGTQP